MQTKQCNNTPTTSRLDCHIPGEYSETNRFSSSLIAKAYAHVPDQGTVNAARMETHAEFMDYPDFLGPGSAWDAQPAGRIYLNDKRIACWRDALTNEWQLDTIQCVHYSDKIEPQWIRTGNNGHEPVRFPLFSVIQVDSWRAELLRQGIDIDIHCEAVGECLSLIRIISALRSGNPRYLGFAFVSPIQLLNLALGVSKYLKVVASFWLLRAIATYGLRDQLAAADRKGSWAARRKLLVPCYEGGDPLLPPYRPVEPLMRLFFPEMFEGKMGTDIVRALQSNGVLTSELSAQMELH